jgi:hypothetical protein
MTHPAIELIVKVSNSEKSTVHKHLYYQPITLSPDNAELLAIVNGAVDTFQKDSDGQQLVEDVVIKAKMVLK